jgi:hypothetical protein
MFLQNVFVYPEDQHRQVVSFLVNCFVLGLLYHQSVTQLVSNLIVAT